MTDHVTINFGGAMILKHRNAPYAVYVDRNPKDFPVTISSAHVTHGMFPLPLPGPGWRWRFYRSLCWSLGRKGRGR